MKRSVQDRMLFGVAGGIAEYFDVDPVLVRVGFVLFAFLNGLGILAYAILAIVTPKSDALAPGTGDTARQNLADMPEEIADAGRRAGERVRWLGSARSGESGTWLLVLGAILVFVGFIVLLANLGVRWFFFVALWPVVIIIAGGLLLLLALRRRTR